ncbi:MAG: hypothetical protein II332_04200 [Kiritimatiellae bacterium]|nr:hypothetical protein [Kiritimatiellia bacterium]
MSVILCVLFILRVISKELPRVWVDKIEQELSTDTFAVELDGVSVSLRRGLYLNNLAIYPKRVAERPILNAHQVRLELDIFSKKPIVDRLKSVSIDSFEIASVSSTTVESGVEKASAQEESFVVLPNLKGVDLYCRKARFFKTDAYNIEANISMKDSTIFCNDIVLNFAESNDNLTQNIFGYVKYDVMKNKLEFSGDGKLKTEILLPLFADLGLKGLNRELEKIEFPSVAPDVSAVLKYSPNEAIYNLDLNVNSQHVKYNDVDFVSLVLYLKAHGTNRWSNIDINSLVGRRPEGTLSGSLFIDLDKDVLTFDAISKIRPAHMLTAVGVLDNEERFPLDVELPCQMTASGTVGISKGTANALRIDGNFSARSISFKGMMFENAIGRVDMDYEAWNVNNIEAKLYDGSLNGDISVAPQYVPEKGLSLEKVNFAANFDCKNSSLDTMLRSWSLVKTEDEPFVGLANFNGYLNFDIGNEIDVLRTMVGAAKVDIIDATIYRIPIFAGFTDFMARNVPGLDFILTQNSLKTELNIKDYGVRFENLLVDGPAISITGHGDMWFTGHVDARMRANLLSHDTWVGKGLHFLLFPISKIFELQVYGPINDLSWQTSTLGLSDKETTPEQRGEKK